MTIVYAKSSSLYPLTWLCMKYVCIVMIILLCWLKGHSHETLWIWCERFTHVLLILRFKGHSHLMNPWAIMIPCLLEFLVNSFINTNLSKNLIWILKGIILSISGYDYEMGSFTLVVRFLIQLSHEIITFTWVVRISSSNLHNHNYVPT